MQGWNTDSGVSTYGIMVITNKGGSYNIIKLDFYRKNEQKKLLTITIKSGTF